MKDTLIRGLARNQRVRVFVATTTELVEQARISHGLWATSAAALGRTLTMGAIMGSMLKSESEQLAISINGGGPIGTIMVKAYYDGRVKGFVGDPELLYINNHTGKLDVGLVVGRDGYLKVSKDLGLKNDFTGQVDLISGEIGEDFSYYFSVSEQTPSAVSVGVFVKDDNSIESAGGIVIQLLPNAIEEDIDYIENLIKNLKPVSQLVKEGKTATDIANDLFEDFELLQEVTPYYGCDCSHERMLGALITLDKKDIQEMIDEDHGCEMHCHFCGKTYQFTEEELKGLVEGK